MKRNMAMRCAGSLRLLVASSLLFSLPAMAQSFPGKTITILVGHAAGGTMDTISRLLAPQFQKKWGKPVVVELRGNVMVASNALARSAPDGTTVMMGTNYVAHLFVKEPGFDPVKDIVPVSIVGLQNYFLLASRNAKVRTLTEFVSQAKATPGRFNVGTINGGHEVESNDMMGQLGVRLTGVSYKGIAPVYTALIANEIDVAMGTSTPQMTTGEMIPLAVGGEKRHPDYPAVPTFREMGYRYDPRAIYAMHARAGTPRDILAQIADEVAVVTKSPEFATRITKFYSIEGVGLPPDASAKLIADDVERQKVIVERIGIKPQ